MGGFTRRVAIKSSPLTLIRSIILLKCNIGRKSKRTRKKLRLNASEKRKKILRKRNLQFFSNFLKERKNKKSRLSSRYKSEPKDRYHGQFTTGFSLELAGCSPL
jgi:hypothetical protein